MILAVDPGYAKCGYAIVKPRTGRVVELGVIVTEQDERVGKSIDKSTDRARRISLVSRRLAERARAHAITTIAAEQMLMHGAAAAVAANVLPWGAVAMLAAVLNVDLHEVPAKLWQHAVLPGRPGKVDYDELARQLEKFAGDQVWRDLAAVDKPNRTHALDAVGVGLFMALTTGATRIARAEAAA